MEPDKAKSRQSSRDEYEVAWSTKEPGRTIQRKMLQQQQLEASGSTATASHGEDRSFESQPSEPTWPDRAG